MADSPPAGSSPPPQTPMAPVRRPSEAAVPGAPAPDVPGAWQPAPGAPQSVTVDLFGVPRLLLGAARTEAAGATLGALAADLAARWPALAGPVLDPASGWLRNGYVFVLDGRFTRDPDAAVGPDAEVLLVSSVAGGAA